MKTMISAGIAAFASLLPGTLAAQPAAPLLDKLISHPGSYSQVCDAMTSPQDIPYRAFEISNFFGASFSKANQAEIAKNREPLVKAIREQLLTIDFTKAVKQPPQDPAPEANFDGEGFGCDPATLNPLLLKLVQDLHVIEALPELLVVEDKLVKGIAAAKEDSHAAPPVVDGWLVANEDAKYDENEADTKRDRRNHLFQARVAQRDLVMAMASLMREKAYEPYLKSSFETAYAKGLKALAKENGLANYQPGQPLPEKFQNPVIRMDPITKLPVLEYSPVSIPYSRESRDEIRAAAAKWIAEHP